MRSVGNKENFGYKWNKPENKYFWTDEMDEVSEGFGGEYEECCRFMITKGLEYLERRGKEFNPKYTDIEDIVGVCISESKDAKEFSSYLNDVVEDYFGEKWSPSGAMNYNVIKNIFWIKSNSWEEYKKQLIERKKTNPTKPIMPEKGDVDFYCISCSKSVREEYDRNKGTSPITILEKHMEKCQPESNLSPEDYAKHLIDSINRIIANDE